MMLMKIVLGGELNFTKGYSAIALSYEAKVSQNNRFYLICNKLLDLEIFIIKGSKECEDFEAWLNNEDTDITDDETVEAKSLELGLPHVSTDDLLYCIEQQCIKSYNEGFDDGCEKIQNSIKAVLGL